MRMILIDVALAVTVAVVWLGALALPRLTTAFARLHCASFVNVAASVPVTVAVFLADGPTLRAWKCLALMVLIIVTGAVVSHTTGRALYLRDGSKQHRRDGAEP